MKKLFSLLSVAALLMATASTATAQSDPFKWQVNKSTTAKLGGYVRFVASSDARGEVTTTDFNVSTIPTFTALSNQDQLSFDVSATRLWLEVVQATDKLGNIKFFVETDFRASSNTALRLRQAYISFCGVTVGQAWSFMSDLSANAPTIDIQGVNSRTFLRSYQMSYSGSIAENLTAGVALEYSSFAMDEVSGVMTKVEQSLPDVPLFLQFKSDLGHVKASGVVRALQYGDSNAERATLLGFGGQLSGSLKATNALTFYAQGIYGKGIGKYINDLSSQSVNIMAVDGTEVEAVPMGGASAGFSYKLSSEWSIAASGSMVKNFGSGDALSGYYQQGDYLSATLFYAPTPKLQLGVEALNGGLTKFGSDSRAAANRASIMVKYSL